MSTKKQKQDIAFYNPSAILSKHATYNVIFGERGNGKTYSILKLGLKNFCSNREQMAIVRRWKEDIRGRRAQDIFSALNENNEIYRLSNGEFTGITYFSGKFYACTYDENNKPVYNMETDCIATAFALSDNEHNKSISYPKITTILFDEFITGSSGGYFPDEFVSFMNTVSTIIRQRTNVTIFMLGNTVNRYCPYFNEMGLKHVKEQKQGTIDVYTYGESKLKVAVEYCSSLKKQKKNNFYFAFDNPKLEMITSGAWELDIYPHLPKEAKYRPKDVVFTYFIIFDGSVYQCEIVEIKNTMFTYIHEKTTPLKDTENDLIYTLDHNIRLNYVRNIMKAQNKLQERIQWFYKTDRVFYQDNSVGDAISNYLKVCRREG